jgi:hypothetical protein
MAGVLVDHGAVAAAGGVTCTSLNYVTAADVWSATYADTTELTSSSRRPPLNTTTITADAVMLVPGAIPRQHPVVSMRTIPSIQACIPRHASLLECSEAVVSVIGNSHTGMLIAKNLLELDIGVKLNILYRSDIKHAQDRGGWTKFDGTGLKGTVSTWVTKTLQKEIDSGRVTMTRVLDGDDMNDILESVSTDVAIFANGFQLDYDNLPSIAIDDVAQNSREIYDVSFDGLTGEIVRGRRLFGAGIGFPEYWVDPEGHGESRVGFNVTYFRHLERMVERATGFQQQFEQQQQLQHRM